MSFKLTKPGGTQPPSSSMSRGDVATSSLDTHLPTSPSCTSPSSNIMNPHHRRSLRERLRDGIQSTTAGIPLPSFQTKSHSMDSKSVPATVTASVKFSTTPPAESTTADQFIVVSDRDTLTSLAAKYNSTPNELIRLNRLNSRFIFPGQKLKVPEKSPQHQLQLQRSNSNSVFDEIEAPDTSDVEIRQKKFIKLKVRHITDGNGVVSGTLLITPNAIMFDPNVSDPLVLDQGAEIYGIILPIELIVAAGIFNDISNMRVKQSFIEPISSTNVILYNPEFTNINKTVASSTKPPPATSANKHSQSQFTSHSMTSSQLQLSLSPLPLGKEEKSNILKRFSFPLTSTFSSSDSFGGNEKEGGVDPNVTSQRSTSSDPHARTTSLSLDAESEPEEPKTDDDTDLKLSEIEQWYLCLTTGYPTNINNSTTKTAISPISYGQKKYLKPEYWFSITSEDVNELYCFWNIWWPHLYGLVNVDIISSRGYTLIDWSTDVTTVLNLRGPERRMTASGDDFESKVAAQAQQINELTKESWEMIKAPYGKLYSFLQRGQTILTSTTSCDSNYGSTSSAASGSGAGAGCPHVLNNEQEFEIVSMSELDGKSTEFADFIPELIGGPSLIFKTDKHLQNICKHLTARAEGYPWWLVFSTEVNGFSLGTLYRKMETVDEWSPILLAIEDTHERIFGALISTPLKLSEHFYGTGQSFLFNITPENNGNKEKDPDRIEVPETDLTEPEVNIWKWTGENLFFIKGNLESISIGSGDGKFGLWLDSDLFVGRSDSCWTYGNPPLVPEKDFIVKTLEAWAFGVTTGPSSATTINPNTSHMSSKT